MSIRSHLLLLVLSILVPAVLAAGWVIARTYNAERETLQDNLRDTTRALSQVVDRELAQREVIAGMLARSRQLESAGPLDAEQLALFEKQARAALTGLEGWVELTTADEILLDTRWPESSPPRPRTPEVLLLDKPSVGHLIDGTSPPLYARIVRPVTHNGQTQMNVAVTILPSELQVIVNGHSLPEGWLATVMDARGRIVARRPSTVNHIGRMGRPELLTQLKQRHEGLFHGVSQDGRRVTGYFSTSPRGWTYLTAMPSSAFAPGVPQPVRQLIIGALLLLAVAVGAALLVAQRIVRPVNALRVAADDMRAGRTVQPPATGIRECDAVGGALAEAARTIHASQADLQRQVTAAVAQARAVEQHAASSQRAEALGRLTGGVAHDFNNLLGVISNSAHLMQRHAGDPRLKAPLAAVMRAVEAGSRLTEHLLRVAGRHRARPGSVDLALELPGLRELLRVVLGQRVALDLVVQPGTRPAAMDSVEFELALINLALNARDAMPEGGRVWIEARNATPAEAAELAPGPYVMLSFNDDGQGVDERTAQRAFEPFFTTKAVGRGTGLGLSQVQGFAAQAGGRASLASTLGVGTSVTLLLPAASGDGAPAAAAGPVAEAAPDQRLLGRRVLLVEDNEELARVTAELLRATGCTATAASSPAEALARLDRGETFDVVLTDVVMPGEMDGLALARQLHSERPGLPVVLISGYSSALNDDHGLRVLRKPCTPKQLADALAEAIGSA